VPRGQCSAPLLQPGLSQGYLAVEKRTRGVDLDDVIGAGEHQQHSSCRRFGGGRCSRTPEVAGSVLAWAERAALAGWAHRAATGHTHVHGTETVIGFP
jgi:hypothetical protein